MTTRTQKSGWTSGPWAVAGVCGAAFWDVGTPDADGIAKPNVARVWAVGLAGGSIGEANARLIAQAPAMASLLERIAASMGQDKLDDVTLEPWASEEIGRAHV